MKGLTLRQRLADGISAAWLSPRACGERLMAPNETPVLETVALKR